MKYLQHVEVGPSFELARCMEHWRRACSYCLNRGLPRQERWSSVWAELAPQAKGKRTKRR